MKLTTDLFLKLLIPWLLLCVGINQCVYWSFFDFSALPYLSFSEILIISIESLKWALIYAVVLGGIHTLFDITISKIDFWKRLPASIKKRINVILIIAILITYSLTIIFTKWSFVRLIISATFWLTTFLPFFIEPSRFLDMSPFLRKVAVRILPLLFILSSLYGMDKAQTILIGREYNLFTHDGIDYKLLGKTSDYFIVLAMDNSVITLIAISEVKKIALRRIYNERQRTSASVWFFE